MNYSLSFTSKIKIINCPVKTTKKLAETYSNNYASKRGGPDCWTQGEIAYSDSASVCTIAAVQNGDQVFMIHLNPSAIKNSFDKVQKVMTEKIIELKKANGDLKGILVGAESPERSNYKMLENLFKELDIDFSKLLHQKISGIISLFYSVKDDVWKVYNDNLFSKTADDAKELFNDVYISAGDTVETIKK